MEELNFLGDSPGFGSGIHMAPPGWSGFLWGSPLFCMGSSAILLRRHICLRLRACLGGSLLLSFRDPVFGRISSFPRLALPSESFPCSVEILRSPSLTYGKEKQRICVRFFFWKDSPLCLVCRNGNGSSSLSLCVCFRGVLLDPDFLALQSPLITVDTLLAIGFDLGFGWDLTLCWESLIVTPFLCGRFYRTLTNVT